MHVSMSIYKNVLEEYKQIKEDCIPQLMGRWNDAVTAYGKALALNELKLSLQLIQWTNLATTTTTAAEKGGGTEVDDAHTALDEGTPYRGG
ncbi:hypothetical protein FOZ63_023573, partial [Perkinsus olseni]